MTDLDDNDLADIRKMQRMQAPRARSLVVNLAVFGPTLVIGILGLTLGLYVGRVRIIFGALVFALGEGERERERRSETFTVELRLPNRSLTLYPASEDEFARYGQGSRHFVRLSTNGGFTVEGRADTGDGTARR